MRKSITTFFDSYDGESQAIRPAIDADLDVRSSGDRRSPSFADEVAARGRLVPGLGK
jgi:hypothetical protein